MSALAIGLCVNVAAGIAVYRMRVAALACMHFLLASTLDRMIGPPIPPVLVLNLLVVLTLGRLAQPACLALRYRFAAPSWLGLPLAVAGRGLARRDKELG